MLLVDDLLTFPGRGLLAIFREIHNAVRQESVDQAQAIRDQLRDLYLALEGGKITEADFDAHESELLDRLDTLEAFGRGGEEDEAPPAP
ncbi:MAG TPA: gas vesicle protein GvpG [Planctomycetota bacterium]|nr:gas vesicle protein GvpG [Planctomycetota bacterium]